MNPRQKIYYWKCDRPAALHGTDEKLHRSSCESQLADLLREQHPEKQITLRPASGQGNHITFLASVDGTEMFVRIEDGPEHDDYIEVESRVIEDVCALGVPAPHVFGADASRQRVSFAWQLLENIPHPDLNQLHKEGRLEVANVAGEIGAAVARWQAIQPPGFGPFDPELLRREERLEGFHKRYADYFFLQLDRHLSFLAERKFLSQHEATEMKSEIERHRSLLDLKRACLVHKDLALWNILGNEKKIFAFIDWDDCIGGDPMDDLSLLGCFYDGNVLSRAMSGYASVRPLPRDYRRRFWLHLLRNMIVKSVIRVGAGYFDRTDKFFLIGAGGTGADLKTFTLRRLSAALDGLRNDSEIGKL